MNKRQKKIMFPYKEKTDTCPDCSNIPCDCGLPAGYTPTPWTDANEEDGWNPCGWAVDSNLVRELERELTAVTEQRDRLAEAMGEIAYQKLSHELDDYTYEHANWEASWDYIINIARKSLQSLKEP